MKKKNDMLKTLIIIFISSLIFLFINLPEIKLIGLIICILLGVVLIVGIVSMKNKPKHIGLITRLGKKIWKKGKPVNIGEGLNWIFLRGIIDDVIPIDVEVKQLEFIPQKILTPDNVDIEVPISLAWDVDPEESHTYINIGGKEGVEKAIFKILESGLREYSRHPEEGPMSWREMIASGLKTLDNLSKVLCQSEPEGTIVEDGYDHLVKINDKIPTPILMDYFRGKDPPNIVVRKQWGDGKKDEEYPENSTFEDRWRKLENEITKLGGESFKKELEKKINERIVLLEKLKHQKAMLKISNTGAILLRLTIGNINPFGDIYKADIRLQQEERERKSETYEVETDLAKAVILQETIKKMHKKDADIIECFNAIMKWKMISGGKGFVYDGQLGTFAGLGDLISSIMKGGKK